MNSKCLVSFLFVFVFAGARLHAAEHDTVLLNSLGYTTGQAVLLTHMAVGTLADATVSKTYKADKAGTFIATYINVTKGMKDQLNKLIEAKTLSENDNQFVKNTVDVLDLVLKESEALKAYIQTGAAKEATEYDKARQTALKDIKTLLGMKD
jgi:hypothetical protein